jgi:site-specific DNA-methyltransferase (adenine-specific)
VARSIERFGFGAPIVARLETREVIAGHTRLAAAKLLGLTHVPVRFLDLNESEAHLLALADNKLAEVAEWDSLKLAELVKEQDADALLSLGFSAGELRSLMAELDKAGEGEAVADVDPSLADELQKKWQTEVGQVWEVTQGNGVHRILCGDSTDAEAVSRLMGPERAQACWTDPPYGVSYVGKTKDSLTIKNDKLKTSELVDFLSRCFRAASSHALAGGAAVYVAHPPGALRMAFYEAFRAVDWHFRQGLVWAKDAMVLGHSDYHYMHEDVAYLRVPGGVGGRQGRGSNFGWYGDNAQTSLFVVPRPKRSEEHPTMKPVDLIVPMVRNSVEPGGLVYEPFSGSGSTMAACAQTGRFCRAIELDPRFVAVALERMAESRCEVRKVE